jgi:ADP-heptose:LPS heptosyltransferase
MANILAIRFSALGDVVMTIPVLRSFARHYPQHQVTLLSRSNVAPLFECGLPANVHFRGVDLAGYKGLQGLTRLFVELRKEGYDAVADLHDVLRTMYLRFLFERQGFPVATIDKGRHEKRQLVSQKNRMRRPLATSVERYARTFAELGYPFEVSNEPLFPRGSVDISMLEPATGRKGSDRWIGVAPFAQHQGKIYPLGQMERVVRMLDAEPAVRIFLFGAGREERAWCESLQAGAGHVVSMVGRYDMQKELALMNHLDVMLTMDSANMHLASVAGAPVVAVWGATHPFAGFAGLQQPGSVNLQADIDCRPCSIFGNKKCIRKEQYECMRLLSAELLSKTVMRVVENGSTGAENRNTEAADGSTGAADASEQQQNQEKR